MATAVQLREAEVEGSYVTHEGGKYVVCDPTYVNAGPGMVMPRYRETRPRVVAIP